MEPDACMYPSISFMGKSKLDIPFIPSGLPQMSGGRCWFSFSSTDFMSAMGYQGTRTLTTHCYLISFLHVRSLTNLLDILQVVSKHC